MSDLLVDSKHARGRLVAVALEDEPVALEELDRLVHTRTRHRELHASDSCRNRPRIAVQPPSGEHQRLAVASGIAEITSRSVKGCLEGDVDATLVQGEPRLQFVRSITTQAI